MRFTQFVLLCSILAALSVTGAEPPKPLRALLITGGCCHDYPKQKDILKQGLEARMYIVVDQVHTDDKTTKPPLPILGNADYAKGYDVVIHDECGDALNDPATIAAVLAPHRAGLPGVNLHCAVHSYRVGNPNTKTKAGDERSAWFDCLGLQSSGHGPQEPIELNFTIAKHPTTAGFTNWTTIKEELYNNVQIFPATIPLVRGKQIIKKKTKDADGTEKVTEQAVETVVAWANEYGKARVFSTTIGHNNATVGDARYLDLVTRGLLWSCGKLDQGYLKPLEAK